MDAENPNETFDINLYGDQIPLNEEAHQGAYTTLAACQCPICFEIFLHPMRLPECGHVFCEYCIERWIHRVNCCPICRHDVTRRPVLDIDVEEFIEQQLAEDTENCEKLRALREKLQQERHFLETKEGHSTCPVRRIRLIDETSSNSSISSGNLNSPLNRSAPNISTVVLDDAPSLPNEASQSSAYRLVSTVPLVNFELSSSSSSSSSSGAYEVNHQLFSRHPSIADLSSLEAQWPVTTVRSHSFSSSSDFLPAGGSDGLISPSLSNSSLTGRSPSSNKETHPRVSVIKISSNTDHEKNH